MAENEEAAVYESEAWKKRVAAKRAHTIHGGRINDKDASKPWKPWNKLKLSI